MTDNWDAPTIELVGGLFGLLGLGYIRERRTATGILLMISWWIVIYLLFLQFGLFVIATSGYGIWCYGVLYLSVPGVSSWWLKRSMSGANATISARNDERGESG